MKFNVLINQVRALEWGLNAQQAMLFAMVYDAPAWATGREWNGKIYYNLSKKKICDELPLLTSKQDTAYRLMRQLADLGLIHLVSIDKRQYFAFTDKAKLWNIRENVSGESVGSGGSECVEQCSDLGKKSELPRKKIRVTSEKNPRNNIYQDNNNQNNTTEGDCQDSGSVVAEQAVQNSAQAFPVEHSETSPPDDKTSGSSRRGSRLSADWVLPDDWRADALAVDQRLAGKLATIAATFRDYWVSVPGAKGVKLDWRATWRNWVRREAERLGGTGGAPPRGGQFLSAREKNAQRNAEIFDLETAMRF